MMTGVVLCGGQSTRMGDDKGLLLSDNTTWAQIAKNKAEALGLHVLLSVNSQQVETYSKIFHDTTLVVDDETLEVAGPLAGLLSVHVRFPSEDILVLACDMLNMQPLVLEELLSQSGINDQAEAVAFLNHGQVEPLCAVYSARGLAKILSLYKKNVLKKHSLKSVLEILTTHIIPVRENQGSYFKNFNSPDDLRDAD
jgi:molybdenum cofactor guanylyltransferase